MSTREEAPGRGQPRDEGYHDAVNRYGQALDRLLFFVPMLIVSETTLQRAGALVGIASATYLVSVGVRIASRRWLDESATCVRAYKSQLERRRQADVGSARTILLMMIGCALLSTPAAGGPWVLQAIGQLGAGIVVYAYITRQAGRFQARIDDLERLEEK